MARLPTAQDWEVAVAWVRAQYPEDVFPEGGESLDAKSASMARRTCDNITRLAQQLADEQED